MTTHAYIQRVSAQLTTAIDRRDGAAAAAVIERIRLDGHAQLANELTSQLIATGMRRFANRRNGNA